MNARREHESTATGGGLGVGPLFERCRAGDELAWEALVRRFQGRVYGLARQYMPDEEEARDVAQEVFVRLYRNLQTLSSSEALLSWLLKTTRHRAIDRLRARRARGADRTQGEQAAAQLPDAAPGPEANSLQRDRRRLLERALGRLSRRNREIVVLKDIQGLKLVEIAEMLGVPLGTVKSRSNRARLELAEAVRALDPSYGGRP